MTFPGTERKCLGYSHFMTTITLYPLKLFFTARDRTLTILITTNTTPLQLPSLLSFGSKLPTETYLDFIF